MTSRTAITSPVAVPQSSDVPPFPDRLHNMPPVAPPRTSSNHYNTSSGTSSSKRRDYTDERSTASSRRGDHETSRSADMNGSNAAHAESAASRSRRVHHHAAMAQNSSRGTSSPRDGQGPGDITGLPIRSRDASHPTTPSQRQPSREASEVLNKLVVSHPENDVQREKARMMEAQPPASFDDAAPPPVVALAERDDNRRGGRHPAARRDKVVKFGDYHLGNTIGEGEFGKVKLGWKQDGGIQVAIKLIKRDTVGSNPSRLAKIYREIAILRGIQHPNIVRLHEMVETERHIGIILEYASGGELFDYILTHRYLKDNAARRLFAQLVSGVGYLHKKGIVHRDLKLENLLLDRNRNIIITDFGFANTFDADEELSQEEELNLTDREFVKRMGLDKLKPNGTRKGDLMQTSCGSPCYAAPELVVSDSLYTGRKVDVWSCGVILYAMLAGYLPFDDDPANPEGDNINLLYKYIVNTPLTFPEYVTPHSRDLLRRILVPNPRKRADLFEVARHSWLSEYAHVVEFITSSTTTPTEIQNTTVPAEDEMHMMTRSASVRESSRTKAVGPTGIVGGLASKQGTVDPDAEAAARKDSKRRTVQVEYVAPTTQTQRGDGATAATTATSAQSPGRGKSRARSNSQGPVEVESPKDKPLPRDPPMSKEAYSKGTRQNTRPPTSYRNTATTGRPSTRSTSDNVFLASGAGPTGPRPQTGGSMGSVGSMGLAGNRSSYGQAIPPSVAGTNAHGSIQQPNDKMGHPSISVGASAMPPKYARVAGYPPGPHGSGGYRPSPPVEGRGHRRSSTLTDLGSKLLGRNGSMFGGKSKRRSDMAGDDRSRRYPPVSMSTQGAGDSRQSIDSRASRRSFSIGFSKKRSGSITPSHTSQEKQARRFSLLPQSFSRAMGFGKESDMPHPDAPSQQDLPIQDPGDLDERGRYVDDGTSQSMGQAAYHHVGDDHGAAGYQPSRPPSSSMAAALQQKRQGSSHASRPPSAIPAHMQPGASVLNTGSESSLENSRQAAHQGHNPYQAGGFSESEGFDGRGIGTKGQRGTLQKTKRFTDAYEQDDYRHGHEGSSGAAKRVMDFFRRRGRARGGEER